MKFDFVAENMINITRCGFHGLHKAGLMRYTDQLSDLAVRPRAAWLLFPPSRSQESAATARRRHFPPSSGRWAQSQSVRLLACQFLMAQRWPRPDPASRIRRGAAPP